MAKMILRKTGRKYILCKHWNGAVGSTTLMSKMGGIFECDMMKKQL